MSKSSRSWITAALLITATALAILGYVHADWLVTAWGLPNADKLVRLNRLKAIVLMVFLVVGVILAVLGRHSRRANHSDE
jgi:hypothetical protein